MPLPISLVEFAQMLDPQSDDFPIFLNRKTGEFRHVSQDELSAIDRGKEELFEGGEETLAQLRDLVANENKDWLALPDGFEIDRYRIMHDFADTLADTLFADDLHAAIGGRGTFRRFKDMVYRHGVEKEWYAFRDQQLAKFGKQWLEAHDIPYAE